MNHSASLRPTSVTVICILWMVWGLGSAANAMGDFMRAIETKAAFETLGAPLPEQAAGDANFIIALAGAISLVSLAGAVGATFLMWLSPWARTLLEVANWATVGVIVVFACIGLTMPMGPLALAFLLPAIPFFWIARRLRQRDVHEAIYRSQMRAATLEKARSTTSP